ncbi:cyclic-phosphate processing receiver domain-containing protein [Paenibacillus sp. N3.4]|uniref:cyclic-phosphate processing receiver domain-containing protein n=1 Tax=Paenibacillus sp. N3.4 TaxID=2603222 RepID=UPI0037CC737F
MKANIYLDDLSDCPEGFLVARTFEEAIQYFRVYTVELLSLYGATSCQDSYFNIVKV